MSAVTTTGAQTTTAPKVQPHAFHIDDSMYKGAGWILFAAIMFVVSACLNIIWGIAAVSKSHFFVAGASYILSDLNTWGWFAIGFAALELFTALSIWRGGAFGWWFGISVAGLAAILAMMTIPAYPFWSLVLIAIDIPVIYGLAAYGGRPELTQ
ncbi:MAG TPA: hypothetical protein VMU39_03015 [Solirubrobacteraceae bacterium]|nr:hypothetical protein [Solirubrobacteraceae bacterium]